jgi:hypothetical protein
MTQDGGSLESVAITHGTWTRLNAHDGPWGILGLLCVFVGGGFWLATAIDWSLFMFWGRQKGKISLAASKQRIALRENWWARGRRHVRVRCRILGRQIGVRFRWLRHIAGSRRRNIRRLLLR